MSDKQNQGSKGKFYKANRKTIAMATGVAIAIGTVIGVQAFTGSNAYAHLKAAAGYESGWHGRGHKHFAKMSEAELSDRINRMVAHVAIEIDASPAQQTKIVDLVTAVAKDMQPLHNQLHATGNEIHDLLVADIIDRTALENLRAARFAEMETMSKNLVNAVADVAEVLSPEQRRVLEKRIGDFRSMHRGRHRD